MTGTTEDNSATAELATFASELRFNDLPESTVAQAKLSILDTIGCALFGASLPWIAMLRHFVLAEGGAEQSTLWGTHTRVARTQASLVNATAAHSFELDDIHMGGMIHPGALALGAALAASEPSSIDGRRLLASFVAGCEVGARVGLAVGVAHFRAGYHPQGTVGAFVSAASAGRALELDPARLRDAIGLAGTQTAGLMAAQEGSMAKRLHSGLACAAGVRSALLASTGFTGIPNVLEADFGGFLSTMGGGEVRPERLTAGLGTVWETDQIGFKPHASCAAAQSSIDVAQRLRKDNDLRGADVESVTVRASTHAQIHCGWEYRPSGVTAAQMSIPYGVACMLVHGDVSAIRFTDATIAAPEVVSVARRVSVVRDEAIDALGPEQRYTVRLELRMTDGRLLTGDASDRPGGRTRPLSPEQVHTKFLDLASPILGEARARELESAVDHLEDQRGPEALIELMVGR